MSATWISQIEEWTSRFECEALPPLDLKLVHSCLSKMGSIPPDIMQLYSVCNGISLESFTVFPIFNDKDVKRTWKSLERQNEISTSEFFIDVDMRHELFQKFFIFSEVGYQECAAIDRNDFSIWYQRQKKFRRLNVNLREFIEICLVEQTENS